MLLFTTLKEVDKEIVENASNIKNITIERHRKLYGILLRLSHQNNFKEIYIHKPTIAKELKCSIRTIFNDLEFFDRKERITKRIGTFNDNKQTIGNSLFVTMNTEEIKPKKLTIEETKDALYEAYPHLIQI